MEVKRLIVAAMAVGALATALPASASAPRALWVWEGPTPAAIDAAEADGFDTLFVHTPPGFEASSYIDFVGRAHDSGIAVYAMAGDPAWATERNAWKNWVEEVEESGLFDGAVADVEPYLLPQWSDASQRRLIASYLRELDRANGSAGSLDLIVTVPFWWDLPEFDRKGESLVERVLARSDGLVVMAYRDHALGADGIVEHAATEVSAAAAAGKTAWVGIETADVGLDKVTFYEEGRAVLAAELTTVDAQFGGGYSGVAVHHFGSWVTLPD